MSIDFTKPIQTRDGRKVRILCTDRRGGLYPVVGMVMDDRGIETTHCWTLSGALVVGESGFPNDLVNVPPPKKKVMVEVRLYRAMRIGSALNLGIVAIIEGDCQTFGPSTPLATTTVELEYEDQP